LKQENTLFLCTLEYLAPVVEIWIHVIKFSRKFSQTKVPSVFFFIKQCILRVIFYHTICTLSLYTSVHTLNNENRVFKQNHVDLVLKGPIQFLAYANKINIEFHTSFFEQKESTALPSRFYTSILSHRHLSPRHMWLLVSLGRDGKYRWSRLLW